MELKLTYHNSIWSKRQHDFCWDTFICNSRNRNMFTALYIPLSRTSVTPISIGNREWRLRLLHDTFSHYKYGGALPSSLESNPPFDEGTAGISVSAVSVGWWTTPGCYSVPSSRSYSPGSDVTVHSRLLEIENRKNEFYKSNIRSYNINLLYFIKWYFESS